MHHDTVLSVTGTIRSSIYKALLLLRHLFTLICAPGQKFQYLQGIFFLRHRRHMFRLVVALVGWRPNSGYSLIKAGYVWWKVVGNKVIDLKEDIESWIMQLRFCCGVMGWRLYPHEHARVVHRTPQVPAFVVVQTGYLPRPCHCSPSASTPGFPLCSETGTVERRWQEGVGSECGGANLELAAGNFQPIW